MAKVMSSIASQHLDVLHESAVGQARRLAVSAARELGFDPQACEEIALAASELASNLVKHSGGGRLSVTPLKRKGIAGLEIVARDKGPGIADIDRALTDGISTTGSLGIGLGAVNRLMDELDIRSEPGKGATVTARKWLRETGLAFELCPLVFGSALRPMRSGDPNGDVVVIERWLGSALAGIIDGLGHGPLANRAAFAARHYVETHYDLPLKELFLGTGRACRATRGVVMALARFDWEQERLSFASVGNVEARVLKHPESYPFMVRRGILGVNATLPVVTTHHWEPDNVMVIHSDGLRTHWRWEDFAGLSDQPAPELAQEMLRVLARGNDDASLVVIRSRVM